MQVKQIPIDWNQELPVFACEPFLKAVGDEYGWLGGFDEGGRLCFVLPYTIVKKAFFRMVRFRVETLPVGPVPDEQKEKNFLNSAVAYFGSRGADMIIPATTNAIFRIYPEGAIAAPYGTYLIDLRQPEEALWRNIHPKNRTDIRKAEKQGVEIHSGIEHLDDAYRLVAATFKRSQLPFMGPDAFRRMVNSVREQVAIFVAIYHGAIQGCAVNFFSMHSAYSVYAGSIARPSDGATKLLHWGAMRHFRELGVRSYDFVGARIDPEKGSKQEKLMLYKRQLGGQLRQGYMWKCPINRLKYRLYCLAARLRSGGDIVDHEHNKMAQQSN